MERAYQRQKDKDRKTLPGTLYAILLFGPTRSGDEPQRQQQMGSFARRVADLSETIPDVSLIRIALWELQQTRTSLLAAIKTVFDEIARRKVACNLLFLVDNVEFCNDLLVKTDLSQSILEMTLSFVPPNVLRVVWVLAVSIQGLLLSHSQDLSPNAVLVETLSAPSQTVQAQERSSSDMMFLLQDSSGGESSHSQGFIQDSVSFPAFLEPSTRGVPLEKSTELGQVALLWESALVACAQTIAAMCPKSQRQGKAQAMLLWIDALHRQACLAQAIGPAQAIWFF